ncbi:protein phosphatase 2c, putative [Perkinsus marinus ATCC 50983]|uniref:Protein phosphatase 2c, putative n=1 Tax=Perkinsus marinus (strain ATCC 50983 / TXsc) TaxID=423536 RepID=C5K485_PERM5|nr:protein phosphatase 2c, putative [Perkinsus marinus ATCC 50983]EER20701.1 protein phosphatase 2c, putative [Perkinsus marinus ATCC 50983]|eukprot:XP_002788905.1 protein phosphatase 2c, putative [Perkinsus marinus ATCC 50983]
MVVLNDDDLDNSPNTTNESVMANEHNEESLVRQVTRNNLIDLFPDSARRFSLSGKPTNSNQKGFENKKTEAVGLSHITDYRVGYACKKGLKPESPNQDDFFVIGIDGLGMFGVFDGHGPYGHDISSFCHDTLPGLLIKDKEFYSAPRDAFKRAFQYTNMLCEQASSRRKFDSSLSGTTATVVVTRDETIYCAWVGDSRAVIGTIDENGKIVAEDLSRDHKPEIPEEKSRIVAKGGQLLLPGWEKPTRIKEERALESLYDLQCYNTILPKKEQPLSLLNKGDIDGSDIQRIGVLDGRGMLYPAYFVQSTAVTIKMSEIEGAGLGIFAVKPINRGTMITIYEGPKVSRGYVDKLKTKCGALGSHLREILPQVVYSDGRSMALLASMSANNQRCGYLAKRCLYDGPQESRNNAARRLVKVFQSGERTWEVVMSPRSRTLEGSGIAAL